MSLPPPALGVRRERVLNRNRDFYADIATGQLPQQYDVLLTNPPYSGDHKQRRGVALPSA